MQANVAGLRRNIKNIAHNYTDAQKKVREATSNDQWGPSATLMAEIADLTYNTVAMAEIMKMIWKRLNDHGKNWRHVYKALILLEYLIRTGSERVAEQCKQNIFAIQTLNEFQYLEEGKDQGVNVREKAKLLVGLLRDDERLKNERAKALKARERFAQHPSGFGSDGSVEGPTQHMFGTGSWGAADGAGASGGGERRVPPAQEIEFMRPLTVGEEELQLQLAMAMSKEEAAQEEAKRRSDDVRLQLALSQSEQDFSQDDTPTSPSQQQQPPQQQQSHLLDLLDINLGGMSVSGGGAAGGGPANPWSMPGNGQISDPWARTTSPPVDPWAPARPGSAAAADPWLGPTSNGGGALNNNNHHGGGPRANGASELWSMGGRSGAGGGATSADPWLGNGGAAGGLDELPKQTNGSLLNQLNNNGGHASSVDPWAPGSLAQMGARPSPVGAITSPSGELDDFDIITNRSKSTNNNNMDNLLDDMDPLKDTSSTSNGNDNNKKAPIRTPHSFLGENSALVNLDNLIKPVSASTTAAAPATGSAGAFGVPAANPFSDRPNFFAPQPVPSINQLKQQTAFPVAMSQDPWAPVSTGSAAASTTNQPATASSLMLIHDDDDNCEVFVDCNFNPTTRSENPPCAEDQVNRGVEGRDGNGNDIAIDFNASSDDLLFDCNFVEATLPMSGQMDPAGVHLKTTHVTGMGISHELNHNLNWQNNNLEPMRPAAAATTAAFSPSNPFLS